MSDEMWSYIAGEKGENRVRAFERRSHGRRQGIWVDYRDKAGSRHREPLHTTDRHVAMIRTDEIAASLPRRLRPRYDLILDVERLYLDELRLAFSCETNPVAMLASQARDIRACRALLRRLSVIINQKKRPLT